MKNYEEMDKKLYNSKYAISKKGNTEEIWNNIKNDKDLLRWAIQPTKDRLGERDIVNALAITDSILDDYENVDQEIYQELVDLIYYNKQIARISQDKYSNSVSYLLKTLYNPNLVLTYNQKVFAINEAMNKIGTIRNENKLTDYFDRTVANTYMSGVFNILSDTQSHGSGAFDIRYWILKNDNWSIEEKKELINNFWANDEDYKETIRIWQKDAYNNQDNDELDFCKQMEELRPIKKEKNKVLKKQQ